MKSEKGKGKSEKGIDPLKLHPTPPTAIVGIRFIDNKFTYLNIKQ